MTDPKPESVSGEVVEEFDVDNENLAVQFDFIDLRGNLSETNLFMENGLYKLVRVGDEK